MTRRTLGSRRRPSYCRWRHSASHARTAMDDISTLKSAMFSGLSLLSPQVFISFLRKQINHHLHIFKHFKNRQIAHFQTLGATPNRTFSSTSSLCPRTPPPRFSVEAGSPFPKLGKCCCYARARHLQAFRGSPLAPTLRDYGADEISGIDGVSPLCLNTIARNHSNRRYLALSCWAQSQPTCAFFKHFAGAVPFVPRAVILQP